MAKRKSKGRALFYTRDSGGKHETTPTEYVAWAKRKAEEIGLDFDGTPEVITAMIENGQFECGDLFLDYGVAGNVLARNGLGTLLQTVENDSGVSHVLIPRRNRLARPNDPIDGVKIENALRQQGITLVFMDKTLLPLQHGKRQDIGELILATIDYDRSAEDRRELAQKVLHAQLHLAKSGFSTGGRPPYGFRRWLAKADGSPVRQLQPGETVRMAGHHVVWLPGPEEEMDVIRRILEMLEKTPASRVAKTLTNEGVPTPDHGRTRTDNGVTHETSGVWHQSTITNIARNPLLLACVEYGRRSMGDMLRCTPTGPRELEDRDFGLETEDPKVIRNREEDRIAAAAKFDPVVDPEKHHQLLAKLDERAGTQRGKPRSRDPNKNPLGGRVYDLNCGWPLYRTPYGKGFQYKCGLYQQSSGGECSSNRVDGPTAAEFLLSCIRQRVLSPHRLQQLKNRIRELSENNGPNRQLEGEIARKRKRLAEVERLRDLAADNLARATSDEQYSAVAAIFETHMQETKRLKAEIDADEQQLAKVADSDAATDMALAIIDHLPQLARAGSDFGAVRELLDLLNVQLFLGFEPVQKGKRILQKVSQGVVTLGDAPPPIELYEGPTARKKIKNSAATNAGLGMQASSLPPQSSISSDGEGKSIGNVSRGEWI